MKKFNEIIRAAESILQRGISLMDDESKMEAVVQLIGKQFTAEYPAYNLDNLKVALKYVVEINSCLPPDKFDVGNLNPLKVGKAFPITFIPMEQDKFVEKLLERKTAYIITYYKDGRQKVKKWDASRFDETSNLIGNLRSRKDFRRDAAQRAGIVRVEVSIKKPLDMGQKIKLTKYSNSTSSSTTGEKDANRHNDIGTIIPMIEDKEGFLAFLKKEGVGDNDIVADSRASYVSYLNSVSYALGEDLTRELILAEGVAQILDRVRYVPLRGRKHPPSDNTLNRWQTALNRYKEFAEQ